MQQKYATDNTNNLKIYFFCLALAVALISRDIFSISINKFLFVGVIGAFMLISNRDELWCFVCFMIPLFTGLPGTYIRLIALILLLARNNVKIQKKTFSLIVFFSVLEILASAWYPKADFIEILGYITTLGIMFFMLYEDEGLPHKKLLVFYVYGTVLLCIVIVIGGIRVSHGTWLDLLSTNRYRFGLTGEEGMHLGANANELAYYCISGTAVSYCLFKDRRTVGMEKILSLIAAIFIAVTGFMTLSRSYIIVFVGIVAIYVLFKMHDIRKVGVTLFSLLAVILCVYIVVHYSKVGSTIWNGLLVRFARNDLATANDRTSLFVDFYNAYIRKMRFVSLGTGVTKYWDMLGLPEGYSIHNMLEQVIICLGVPGGLIFLYSILTPYLSIKSYIAIHQETLLPFLAVILFSQTIQFINPYTHMLHYLFALYAVKSAIEAEEEYKDEISDHNC